MGGLPELHNRLLPVIWQNAVSASKASLKKWARNMKDELIDAMTLVLPFNEDETQFFTTIREDKIIKPSLITSAPELQKIISDHPALKWAIRKS